MKEPRKQYKEETGFDAVWCGTNHNGHKTTIFHDAYSKWLESHHPTPTDHKELEERAIQRMEWLRARHDMSSYLSDAIVFQFKDFAQSLQVDNKELAERITDAVYDIHNPEHFEYKDSYNAIESILNQPPKKK